MMMCSIDRAIEYIESLNTKADPTPEQIVNRLKYVRDKDVGVKPRFHKGQYGHKFDYWSCRNCGKTIVITDTFCSGCGYRVLWDSTRCLTGKEDDDGK